MGRTGSGKTTLAHLILGLFQPTQGELLLDGIEVSDQEIAAWQGNCAFVPQTIRLIDEAFARMLHLAVSLKTLMTTKFGLR